MERVLGAMEQHGPESGFWFRCSALCEITSPGPFMGSLPWRDHKGNMQQQCTRVLVQQPCCAGISLQATCGPSTDNKSGRALLLQHCVCLTVVCLNSSLCRFGPSVCTALPDKVQDTDILHLCSASWVMCNVSASRHATLRQHITLVAPTFLMHLCCICCFLFFFCNWLSSNATGSR